MEDINSSTTPPAHGRGGGAPGRTGEGSAAAPSTAPPPTTIIVNPYRRRPPAAGNTASNASSTNSTTTPTNSSSVLNSGQKRASIQEVQVRTTQLRRSATTRSRNSAWRVFEKFQQHSNTDLKADLHEQENDDVAKGEIVLGSLLQFSLWLKLKPVEAQGKEKALSGDTICQYFGQVKETIRESTQNLNIWDNHEEVWYSKLLYSVKNAYSSNILEGDMANRDPTCRALHLKCTDGKLMQMQRDWKDCEGADIDSIVKSLLQTEYNNRDCHEERLKILLVYYVVGRGGELKFLCHTNNTWDYYAHSLQGILTRIKTRSQHPFWIQCLPFSETNYRIDFLHAFGSWAAVGDGLYRHNVNENGAKFWFPRMRNERNEKVARDVSTIIKKYVAKCLLPSTSSRGIRVGANTELAMNRNISNEEQRQASGHSANATTEMYVRMNPNMGIPAALALSSWDDVRRIVKPPSLESLPLDVDQVNLLIDKLYHISLPEYKCDGCMRVLLRHTTASLIMYHPYYTNEFDSAHFKLPKKLLETMKECGFSENDDDASQKLQEWSDQIKEKFVSENNLISTSDDDTGATILTMTQTINNQSLLINKLLLQQQKMSNELTALMRRQADQHRMLDAISNYMKANHENTQTMIKMMNQVGRQTDFITQSEERRIASRRECALNAERSPSSLPRKDLFMERQELEMLLEEESDPHDTSATVTKTADGGAGAGGGNDHVSKLPPVPWSVFIEHIQGYIPKDHSAIDALTWKPFTKANKSCKGLEIRDILMNLLGEGMFVGKKKFRQVKCPTGISENKNGGAFSGMMQLCDLVVEDDEKQVLFSSAEQREEIENHELIVKSMLYNIHNRAFQKMADLDGKTSAQIRPTLMIGKRYNQWAKNNKNSAAVRSPTQQTLNFTSV